MILQTLAAFVLLTTAAPVHAQVPAFEVATVKPSTRDEHGGTLYTPSGGRFAVANYTLKNLIATAYGVENFQISGGPGWIDSTRYDIVAQAEKPVPLDQLKQMLQPLLAERFQLTLRHSTKELPYYALLIGRSGPKLQPSQAASPQLRGRHSQLTAQKIPLAMLASQLAENLGRPVIDQTGLTGEFDINLQWTPDDVQPQTGPAGPSIFTALQEQAGLRLESRKGPVQLLIVDRAERPSGN